MVIGGGDVQGVVAFFVSSAWVGAVGQEAVDDFWEADGQVQWRAAQLVFGVAFGGACAERSGDVGPSGLCGKVQGGASLFVSCVEVCVVLDQQGDGFGASAGDGQVDGWDGVGVECVGVGPSDEECFDDFDVACGDGQVQGRLAGAVPGGGIAAVVDEDGGQEVSSVGCGQVQGGCVFVVGGVNGGVCGDEQLCDLSVSVGGGQVQGGAPVDVAGGAQGGSGGQCCADSLCVAAGGSGQEGRLVDGTPRGKVGLASNDRPTLRRGPVSRAGDAAIGAKFVFLPRGPCCKLWSPAGRGPEQGPLKPKPFIDRERSPC